MLYAILPRADWNGQQPVCDSAGATIVHVSNLTARVDAFTGRAHVLGIPSVSAKLRRDGRVFVAARGRGTGGLLVERVR